MKNLLSLILLVFASLSLGSCVTEEEFANTPEGNFEALWKIVDEHYCFFDYKQKEYGLDWNKIHDKYADYITPSMTSKNLLDVCGRMLDELRDGHVNIYTKSDVARYWNWYEDYPRNFNDSIHQLYLGNDYKIASGLKYKILDDNIGYIYYDSFSSPIGDGNLSEVLQAMALCTGIIVDIRENGGGNLTYADKFASRFTNEKLLVGYISHKTGTGHNDFSSPEPIYLEPASGVRWQKKAVVLTNRRCFSSANDFVKLMKRCPKVTVIGDRTGGGGGLPFSSELPNGWSIRFSASPMFDADMNQVEFGIEPDINVSLSSDDILRNRDTLIEYARDFLKK